MKQHKYSATHCITTVKARSHQDC